MKTTRIDRTFKAFADETRLRILALLRREGELCVCDLTAVLRIGQSKISRHLAYLKKAGLVRDRKDGLWSHYSLTPPAGGFHRQILKCLDASFEQTGALKRDRNSLKRIQVMPSRCK